jgi:hypothetical protein
VAKLPSLPQPATELYKGGGGEPVTIRDRFVQQYGEGTVQRAELQVCLDLFMLMNIVKPQEFVEVLERKLRRIDDMRRAAAGFSD